MKFKDSTLTTNKIFPQSIIILWHLLLSEVIEPNKSLVGFSFSLPISTAHY